MIRLVILSSILYCSIVYPQGPFGVVTVTKSNNIGDDIQSLAALAFLPKESILIDREEVGQFTHEKVVKTILNGWFLDTRSYLNKKYISAEKKSWPPSRSIDPLFISIHFKRGFLKTVLSKANIRYLKKNGPIGARDLFTLEALQSHGVPSYFSGCLTLTLENDAKEKDNVIYAVDLDEESLYYLREHSHTTVISMTHNIPPERFTDSMWRFNLAKEILEKYKRAKCVVTTRFHAALPCIAYGTPVLVIEPSYHPCRFSGFEEILRICLKDDFIAGKIDFDFENPPENSNLHLTLRENLKLTVKEWVKTHLDL